MQWLLLGVLVIALLWMSTRYTKTAFSILGALGVAAVIIIFSTQEDALQGRHKLPVDDITIENAVIVPAYGGSYQINARLVNTNSSILLKELVISVTMFDCPGVGDDGCMVIGQTDERVNIKIPPGQARDISRTLLFHNAKPSGTIRWEYRVTETRS